MTGNELKINGWDLPDALIDLMDRRQWKRPRNTDALKSLTGMLKPEKLDFLDLRKIGAESQALFNLYRDGHGALYGLSYSGEGTSDPNTLDVHRMIVLAVNDDEEGIALDYRTEPPAIICGTWSGTSDNEQMCWKQIAPDFESFARTIGIL